MAVDHKELVKHQLRDAHGRWIKMGFKVKWSDLDGNEHTGTVVGAKPDTGFASFKPTAIVREYDKHGHDLGHTVEVTGTKLNVISAKAVLQFDAHGNLVVPDPHHSLVGMPEKLHKASHDKVLGAHQLKLEGEHSASESAATHGLVTKLGDLKPGDELYPVHSTHGNGKSPYNITTPSKDAMISTKHEDSLGTVVKNDPAKGYITVKDGSGKQYYVSKNHYGVVRNASTDEALIKSDHATGSPTPWIKGLEADHHSEAEHSAHTAPEEHAPAAAPAPQSTVHAVQDPHTGKIKVSTSDYSPLLSDVSTLKPGDQVYPRADNYGHNGYSTPKVLGDSTAVVEPAGAGLGTVVKVDNAKGTVRIKLATGQTATLKFGDNVFKRTNEHDKTLSDAFTGYSEHNQQHKWLGEVKAAHETENAPQAPKEEPVKAEMPTKPEFVTNPYRTFEYSPKQAPSKGEKPASDYKAGDILVPPGNTSESYVKRSDGNWDLYLGSIHNAGKASYKRTVSDPFAEPLPQMWQNHTWDAKLIHDGQDPKALAEKNFNEANPPKPSVPSKPEPGTNLKAVYNPIIKKVKVSDAGNIVTSPVSGLKLGDKLYPIGDTPSQPYSSQLHNVHDGSALVDVKSEKGLGTVVHKASNGATVKGEDGKTSFISSYSGGQVLKQSDALDKAIKDATPAEHAPAAEVPHVETPAEAEHKAEVADHPMSIDGWKKVAGKSGSNPGGVYEDPNGKQWMVKFPQTSDHARNEVLAANLTKLAGIEATDMQLIDAGNGKLGVAAPMVKIKDDLKQQLDTNPEFKAKVQEGFAVDAWLANWDTIGLEFDNIVSDENGNPLRVDPGGSLLYRAMGTPKGDAFGNSVGEWDTLRNGSNANTAKAFGDMTDQQLIDSAKRVESITPEEIAKQVDAMGFDEAKTKELKDKLIARREDVISRAAALKPAHEDAPTAAPAHEEPAAPAEPAQSVSLEDLNSATDGSKVSGGQLGNIYFQKVNGIWRQKAANSDGKGKQVLTPMVKDFIDNWGAKFEKAPEHTVVGEELIPHDQLPQPVQDYLAEPINHPAHSTNPAFANFKGYNDAEVQALDKFLGTTGNMAINKALRTGKHADDQSETVAAMDQILAKSPLAENLTVWRGINARPELIQKITSPEGGMYLDKGFTSSSLDKKVATEWVDFAGHSDERAPLLLQVELPAGYHAHGVDYNAIMDAQNNGFDHEQEVVLPRGSAFDVVDVKPYTNYQGTQGYHVTVKPILTESNYTPQTGAAHDAGAPAHEEPAGAGSEVHGEPHGGPVSEPAGGTGTEGPAAEVPQQPAGHAEEVGPGHESAPAATPQAPQSLLSNEDVFAGHQFIDKGKTTLDSNGETLKVGDLINHKSGKHGTGKVLKVLPSTDTVQVVYPNGTEIKHKGNTVSKVMEHAAPKTAEELPKIQPGEHYHDATTGKSYIGAKDGTPLTVGDRITYTKQGQTKSGVVKSIYKGDSAVSVKWDDGSTSGTKKKASAVLKEESAKPEAPAAHEAPHEAPAAPEAPVHGEPASAPAHEAPAAPEHTQPEPAAPQDGTALNETEKALDTATGNVSAADFEGKNFGEVPDKVIENAPAGSSLVSKSEIHDGTKSVFVKGEDGKWSLEGTQAKLDTQDMLGTKAGAGDKFTFHGPSEDGPKAPTEPATASDIASYDGKSLSEVPADHIASLPVGTRLVKENGIYREKTDDNSWKSFKKDGALLLSTTQNNEDIQSIASHSGTSYKIQLPGATPEPTHEAPSTPEPGFAQYNGKTFDHFPAEEIPNLPVGTKLHMENGSYREKTGKDRWTLFFASGNENPNTIGKDDHAIAKFHTHGGDIYTMEIPGAGTSAPSEDHTPSNDVSAHDGAKLKDIPDDVIKNAPAGSYFTSPMGSKTIKGEDGMWHTMSGSKVGSSTLISKKEEGGAVANGFKFHSPDGTSHDAPSEQPSGADLWKVGASTESTNLLTADAPVGSELTGEDGHVFVKVGKDKWQSVWPDGDPQPGHLDNQEVQHALNSGEQHWKVSDTNASEKADPFAAPEAAPEPVDVSHVADENGHIAPSALSQLVGMKIKDIHGLNFDELPTGTKIGNGDGFLVKGSEGWKVISPGEAAHGTYMNHGLIKMIATSDAVDPSKDWTLASVGHGSGEDFLSQPQISGNALQAHVGQKLYEMPPINLSGASEGTQITKDDGTHYTKVGPNAWQVGGTDWTGHSNWTDLSVKDSVYSSPDGTLEHTLTSAGNGSAAPAQSGTTLGDFNQSGFHGLEKGTQIKYTGYDSTKGVYTKTGEDTWSFTPEGHPTASNKVITNAMFEHVLGTDSAKNYSVTPPEHAAAEAATSEVTDPHLQTGMDPSVGYLDSLPGGSTIRVEKSWVATSNFVFAAKNEDGSWNIYKKTPSTLKTYKESVSANDARYYLGVSYGGTVTASLPKGDKSAILGSGELAHVGDTVMYEHQPHEVLKVNKTGLSLQPVNGGEKVSAKPSKLYKDANFSKAEHTYHSNPTVHDPISKSYEGYQKEQEAKNALKNFAGASADEYNAQGLTMPHDANPDLSSSVKAYGADPVDTSNPLYGAPKPEAPQLQLPEAVTLPSKWDSAGWLEQVKQRYLDNPNKAKASLEQSNKWNTVMDVVTNGDKASLDKLLSSQYVDQKLYDDAVTKINAGNEEYDAQKTAYDNAVKAATDKYDAEKAKYQSDLADWNKANPAAVDKPYVAAVLPAVSQENFASGPADWTKAHIGTHTASTVMAAIKDDNVLGTHGLSFAVDSDQIEYLDVKATKVLDKSGTEVFEFKFKVTGLHGDALVAALDKRQGVSKSSGMHLVQKKPDPATGLLKDTEGTLGDHYSGNRYTYTDSETGASVVYQGGAAHSDHNNATLNNTAVIQMPIGSTPEDFQKTIENLGIENARPSTEGDIRVLGENQILAMFGKSVGNTKIWDSNKNFSGPQREKQLSDIKEKYGVSVDDLVFKTEQNGRVRFELSDEKAQALAERYGVLGATHNVSGAHDANTWVSVLSGDNPGLLSTYHRWSEGIGGSGMSSQEDMSNGSGDYIYMTPFTASETHKATSGYKAVLKPSALFKRVDWYANSSDNYGKKGSSNSSPYGLFDAKGGSTHSGIYEALPKDTVPIKDFSHVVISDDHIRQQVIDKLKAKGVYEINGFPVEEFVIGNNGQPPHDLTKYA